MECEPSFVRHILSALKDIIQSMRQLLVSANCEARIEQTGVMMETALNERAEWLSQMKYSVNDVDPKYLNDQNLIQKGTSLPLKTGTPAQSDGVTSDKDHPSMVSLRQQVKDVKE